VSGEAGEIGKPGEAGEIDTTGEIGNMGKAGVPEFSVSSVQFSVGKLEPGLMRLG
jgi:hypothetical protein